MTAGAAASSAGSAGPCCGSEGERLAGITGPVPRL